MHTYMFSHLKTYYYIISSIIILEIVGNSGLLVQLLYTFSTKQINNSFIIKRRCVISLVCALVLVVSKCTEDVCYVQMINK